MEKNITLLPVISKLIEILLLILGLEKTIRLDQTHKSTTTIKMTLEEMKVSSTIIIVGVQVFEKLLHKEQMNSSTKTHLKIITHYLIHSYKINAFNSSRWKDIMHWNKLKREFHKEVYWIHFYTFCTPSMSLSRVKTLLLSSRMPRLFFQSVTFSRK